MWYMVHLTVGLGTILLWLAIELHILLERLSLIIFYLSNTLEGICLKPSA